MTTPLVRSFCPRVVTTPPGGIFLEILQALRPTPDRHVLDKRHKARIENLS